MEQMLLAEEQWLDSILDGVRLSYQASPRRARSKAD